ncbi:unnamed protein product [Gongylonema pulchrum]|uniref:AP-5 complex subunit beta-1 n=1 Tax=Gongylonema pulchrum TaxID=637853 RepID=A0A183DIB5_9BILA|nr:unnamed protein product [Gongylonema pulchrum]
MPAVILKNFAELILSLLSVPNSDLRCCIYQCFYRILQQQPADTTLSFDTNVHLIVALRELVPSVPDPAVTAFWIQVCVNCLLDYVSL